MPGSTTDLETLASRLDAVERALTDGSAPSARPQDPDRDVAAGSLPRGDEPTPATETAGDPSAPGDRTAASRDHRCADLEASVSDLEDSVADLSAELDAVRGLLGGVRAVNESVERRADLALAVAEELADDEAGELVVERLPDADADAAELDADGSDDEAGRDSLAARLREAL